MWYNGEDIKLLTEKRFNMELMITGAILIATMLAYAYAEPDGGDL